MPATVSNIWRHPIKGLGCEPVDKTLLTAGETLPFDRIWAVIQKGAVLDLGAPEWVSKRAFNQGAKSHAFMAIRSRFDPVTNLITLTHPDLAEITVNPDTDAGALVAWVEPLVADDLPQPAGLAKLEGNSFTDQEVPYISIISKASLAALSDVAGQELEQERFRANIWLDGLEPWAEFDWMDKEIRIGSAILRVEEPIGRCIATTANPATGVPDVETLTILRQNWGHRNLGVFARVLKSGDVALNDTMEVL